MGGPVIEIEHVGSTAIAGLVAKPILDVAVGVKTCPDVDVVASQLVAVGYLDRGTGVGSVGRLLVREVDPGVRAVHVHVMLYRSRDWRHYIVFRDVLQADDLLRREYAQVKQQLAQTYGADREAYTQGKNVFISRVLAEDSPSRDM